MYSMRRRLAALVAALTAGATGSVLAVTVVTPTHAVGETLVATIVETSDIHADGYPAANLDNMTATAKVASAQNPDGILLAGDSTLDGLATEYQAFAESGWGTLRPKILAAPGNHDWHQAPPTPFLNYFGYSKTYNSRDVSGVHLITLDADTTTGSPSLNPGGEQYDWLHADLDAHAAMPIFAAWHYPRYSVGNVHGDQDSAEIRNAWSLLQEHGAEMVFSGHDHLYQRFPKANADGTLNPSTGLREIVGGTGGSGYLYGVQPGASVLSPEYTQNTTEGVVRIKVYTDHLEWAHVGVDGVVRDSGSDALRHPVGGGDVPFPTSRDPHLWPFSQGSIWNMPIGSNAVYAPANLQSTAGAPTQPDDEYIGMNPTDPLKTLTADDEGVLGQVHVPPGMHWDGSWNGSSAFLAADGDTVWQGQPLRLQPGGDPAWANTFPHVDPVTEQWSSTAWAYSLTTGDGRLGSHGGSHLSALGGSIRPGELTGYQPIHHALKINVNAARFLYNAGGNGLQASHRWPAASADDPATHYGTSDPQLSNPNPKMVMGALLAIPPGTDLSSLQSPQARKIAEALRDYGAYIVDDTAGDYYSFAVDVAALDEWQGGAIPSGGHTDPQTVTDLQAIYPLLQVVDNNGPGAVGGGGTPRQPLAPPFQAGPANSAPIVNAGSDQTVTLPGAAALVGTVTDDGLPSPAHVTAAWTKVSGPGTVAFTTADALETSASFSTEGTYVLRLTANDGVLAGSDDLVVTVELQTPPPSGTVTITRHITVRSDDAEEYVANYAVGTVALSSSDLDLVTDGTVPQAVGLRFTNIAAPAGASIVDARIQLKVDEATSGVTALTLRGQAADNPTTFAATTNNITSRPTTTSTVGWTPDPWPIVGAAGADQRTPNLAALFQEIVNRPGWASGNAAVVMVTGTGARVAESVEGSGGPSLTLTYGSQTPPSPTNQAPVVSAGVDQSVTLPRAAILGGTVTDDGLPTAATVTHEWIKVSGPGTVTFDAPSALSTTAAFSDPGTYVLRLSADDTALIGSDDMTVTVLPASPPPGTTTLERRVAAGSDDAEQNVGSYKSGTTTISNNDLELVVDGRAVQRVGLRFTAVAIPRGATISNAWLEFKAKDSATGTVALQVQGEAADNPLTYAALNNNITNRTMTTASVPWAAGAWTAGSLYRTSSLAPVIQEIVNRPGWVSGNPVALQVSGTSGTRNAYSFNGRAAGAPLLHVEWTAPPQLLPAQ